MYSLFCRKMPPKRKISTRTTTKVVLILSTTGLWVYTVNKRVPKRTHSKVHKKRKSKTETQDWYFPNTSTIPSKARKVPVTSRQTNLMLFSINNWRGQGGSPYSSLILQELSVHRRLTVFWHLPLHLGGGKGGGIPQPQRAQQGHTLSKSHTFLLCFYSYYSKC